MNNIEPKNQIKLFGLDKFLNELIKLYKNNNLPNKILLSGQKGLGKCTLAYHFINFVLSKDEKVVYDLKNKKISSENHSYKTILNGSNPNFFLIDVKSDNKFIDINQIRELISNLNKSSLNNKPRFILIDNIEFLNVNSINAILKILEEPSINIYFILINNNKNILPTLLSRCINFKIFLSNKETIDVNNNLLGQNINNIINKDLINYYSTPGNLVNLINFADKNGYDLKSLDLKKFLKLIIDKNDYKKDILFKYLIYDFIEFYFNKLIFEKSTTIFEKYHYFLKRISETKKFNLDEETLFIEFQDKILNG